MSGLTKKKQHFFHFHLHTMKPHQNFFTKPKPFSLVLSLLSDHVQGSVSSQERLSDFNKIKFYQHLYHLKKIVISFALILDFILFRKNILFSFQPYKYF